MIRGGRKAVSWERLWQAAAGRCECSRDNCHGEGRCTGTLPEAMRQDPPVRAIRADRTGACFIICETCIQATAARRRPVFSQPPRSTP
jgi:hypothetical protein